MWLYENPSLFIIKGGIRKRTNVFRGFFGVFFFNLAVQPSLHMMLFFRRVADTAWKAQIPHERACSNRNVKTNKSQVASANRKPEAGLGLVSHQFNSSVILLF